METKVSLNFTIEKVNLIIAALAELPYKTTVELIADIHNQTRQQLEPPVTDVPTKSE